MIIHLCYMLILTGHCFQLSVGMFLKEWTTLTDLEILACFIILELWDCISLCVSLLFLSYAKLQITFWINFIPTGYLYFCYLNLQLCALFIYFWWYLDYIWSDIIIIKSPVIKVLQSITRTFLLKIKLALFWYKSQQLIQKSKVAIITTPVSVNLKSWLPPPVVREREPGDCGRQWHCVRFGTEIQWCFQTRLWLSFVISPRLWSFTVALLQEKSGSMIV